MNHKRITIISGHYGSGKTNVAVNIAFELKKTNQRVAIADLDIVNPYFRVKDSEKELKEAGIRLIASEFANSNIDIPALPQEMYALVDDKGLKGVIDLGGDEQGAVALARLSPLIKEENDYEMFIVINRYRPLTSDADSVIKIMKEIEMATNLAFTGIINNSNIGSETTMEDVIDSVPYAEEIANHTGLPVVMTCAHECIAIELKEKIGDVFSLNLQKKI